MLELGTVTKLSLKDLWLGESTHFTPWLSENLAVLGEKLGMDLELDTREASVGDFSADIIANDLSTNHVVVIENQFGNTDHKHLGQILTYSSVLGASVVVWIAETIRQEHKSAIDFLNQNLKDTLQLYAVEASLMKIDQSKPAFLLTIVCQPTDQTVSVPQGEEQVSETGEKYRAYFQTLIDELRVNHHFTNARASQPQNWYTFASENSKVYKYGTSFANGGRVRAEIYLDRGDKTKNEQLFDCLLAQQQQIEEQLGGPLSWERLDGKRACRIVAYRDGDIDATTEDLTEIRKWAIDKLLKLKAVFPQKVDGCLRTISSKGNVHSSSYPSNASTA
jgi:Domain of unknown function (DUF4268)